MVTVSRMGSTSITSSSLYSANGIQKPEFLKLKLCKSLKPPLSGPFINSPCLHESICNPLPPFQLTKLQISSRRSHVLTNFSASPSFITPPSKLSNVDYSLSPKKFFCELLSKSIVVLLIGSFIIMGFCKTGAVIALPAQTSSSSANMEGKSDAQKGESEEEEKFEKILEYDPKNVEALKVLLYGKMRRGKPKEALKYVERLIDEEPDEVEWRLLMALCHEMMGDLSKAKRLFKEILKERPLLLRALHVCFIV